jgi:hypothetical protein
MTDLATGMPSHISHATSRSGYDNWRRDRIIEARRILAEAPRHRRTLVALAARVLADAPQMGGAA